MRLLPCMMDGAYFPLQKGYLSSRAATSSRKITHRDGALRSRSGTPFRHLGSSGHMRLHMRSQLSARAGSPIRKYCTLLDCPAYVYSHLRAATFSGVTVSPGGSWARREKWLRGWRNLTVLFQLSAISRTLSEGPFPQQPSPPPPSAT